MVNGSLCVDILDMTAAWERSVGVLRWRCRLGSLSILDAGGSHMQCWWLSAKMIVYPLSAWSDVEPIHAGKHLWDWLRGRLTWASITSSVWWRLPPPGDLLVILISLAWTCRTPVPPIQNAVFSTRRCPSPVWTSAIYSTCSPRNIGPIFSIVWLNLGWCLPICRAFEQERNVFHRSSSGLSSFI